MGTPWQGVGPKQRWRVLRGGRGSGVRDTRSSLLPVQPELKGKEGSWKDLGSDAPTMQCDPGNADGDTRGPCQVTAKAHRLRAHQVYKAGP